MRREVPEPGGERHTTVTDGSAPAGGLPVGAEGRGTLALRTSGPECHPGQLREARASFQVADGRMTSAALAGSGW
jgi:hypothetical protein